MIFDKWDDAMSLRDRCDIWMDRYWLLAITVICMIAVAVVVGADIVANWRVVFEQ